CVSRRQITGHLLVASPNHLEVALGDSARLQRLSEALRVAVHQREQKQTGPTISPNLEEIEHLIDEVPCPDRSRVRKHGPVMDSQALTDAYSRFRIELEMIDVDTRRDDRPWWQRRALLQSRKATEDGPNRLRQRDD